MRWDASRTQQAARPASSSPRSPLLLHHRYHTEGFLQKNNNMLHSDLELVLKAATDPFVATMVAEAEAKLAAQQEKNPKKGGGDKGGRFASVSAHFLGQLNQLTTTVTGRHCHDHHHRHLHPFLHLTSSSATPTTARRDERALCPLHQPEHDEEARRLHRRPRPPPGTR